MTASGGGSSPLPCAAMPGLGGENTVDYIGCKRKLVGWILGHINQEARSLGLEPEDCTFMDACSGTGVVSVDAAASGYGGIIANDLLPFAGHMARGKLCLPEQRADEALDLVQHVNGLAPEKGYFWRQYSPGGPEKRMYLSEQNAARVDAARHFVRQIENPTMQSYLWYCLTEALSRVSNTAGVQASYLKKFKARAQQPFNVRPEPVAPVRTADVQVYQEDILALLTDAGFRSSHCEAVLYVDPPYNHRQYGANYHLYNALVSPSDLVVKGKTGLPVDYPRSEFCRTGVSGAKRAGEFVRQVVASSRATIAAVSYSSDGTIPLDDLVKAVEDGLGAGRVRVHRKSYKRYRAAKNTTTRTLRNDVLWEYLVVGCRG